MKLTLGVLDQSPIGPGENAQAALRHTLELASATDRMGYSRFWVSEHHNAPGLAGSSPEVLLAAIGAYTRHIRIGSGGVLLPHYSPYKVAENFRVLEGLYPGRIDLGIGRAPGGMPLSSVALRGGAPKQPDERFPESLRELASYLEISPPLGREHPLAGLKATPLVETVPELWLLGSSGYSAAAAAQMGSGFSFAHFINGYGGQGAVRDYRRHYRPGPLGAQPKVNVCVFVICTDSDAAAEREASAMDLRLLYQEKGEFGKPFPTPEEASAYPYSEWDRTRIAENRQRMIVGGPDRVRSALTAFAASYGAEEVMVNCLMSDFRLRMRSYELLAEMFPQRQR
ncbi:LLM class flavin-dependent oxidoreductase [Cohnella lubricantis]|uniref:LLM class flavin-dependent oxidoreductase n=1 Tax=Cohnella lubricantis TaxID=2163172 RepID=A0A841TGQ9_9BACL|nr:LLM class flavin-dependent oxidoreductase [Cohnella lubricantis]MBB6678137.1 LLM class flavin-dependent oxidoreductase [Cohnella lubricantis]MBP2116690.1 luciferase family oxidoreductase group 1 [Cohnella lubricantis]